RELRCCKRQELGSVYQHFLCGHGEFSFPVISEAIRQRLQKAQGCHIGHLLRSIYTSCIEWYIYGVTGVPCCFFNRRVSCQYDQISDRHFFSSSLAAIEVLLDAFQYGEYLLELSRMINLPIFLRSQPDSCTIGTATL